MSDEIRDALSEMKMLRDLVGRVVEHLAAGGKITRGDVLAMDLRRMHRKTRAQSSALAQLEPVFRLREQYQVLVDSMLEVGGAEVTESAALLARALGIPLRISADDGKTWVPFTSAPSKPGRDWDHLCPAQNGERIRMGYENKRCRCCGLEPGTAAGTPELRTEPLFEQLDGRPGWVPEPVYPADGRQRRTQCAAPAGGPGTALCLRPTVAGTDYCRVHALARWPDPRTPPPSPEPTTAEDD